QILLDLLVLLKDLLVPHTGPDRDGGKATTPTVSRLGEKLPSPPGIIGVALQLGVKAHHPWGKDPPGQDVAVTVHVSDQCLAVYGIDQSLPHPSVVQRLDAGVESVKPHAEHRTLDMDVVGRGEDPAVLLRRNRRVLEVPP